MKKFSGLTSAEVTQRRRNGEYNKSLKKTTKSIGKIIADNVFSFFNIINIILFFLIMLTGQYKNAFFIGVLFTNTLTGIFQEMRAKRTVDRLSVINESTATVIRNGIEEKIPCPEIVKDDIILFTKGCQASVDCRVLDEENLSADESLLTGENLPIRKTEGDLLLSGSYILGGKGYAKAETVGEKCYSALLTVKAKQHKKAHSEILADVEKIVRIMSFLIAPAGILLYIVQMALSGLTWQANVVRTVASMIGMIPNGLVLLITAAYCLGVYRVSYHNALVQEPAIMEIFSSTDVICFDKTGTLTDGAMHLTEINTDTGLTEIKQILKCIADADIFEFSQALYEYAADVKLCHYEKLGKTKEIILNGNLYRIKKISDRSAELYTNGKKTAQIYFDEKVRTEIPKTIEYFDKHGVEIKVISGDNPVYASKIAKKAGIKSAEKYIDISGMDESEIAKVAHNYTVFGRVSPEQKQWIVRALKKSGLKVSMAGDGVNDLLALREADCGISPLSGTDAARGVSGIILMNSDFSALQKVFEEGRCAINNIQKASCLYLNKTAYSLILTVFTIVYAIFGTVHYPYEPIQLTVISLFAVGIPSALIALEKNNRKLKDRFLSIVLSRSIPAGLSIAITAITLMIFADVGIIDNKALSFSTYCVAGFAAFHLLIKVCKPLTLYSRIFTSVLLAAFVATLYFGKLLNFGAITPISVITAFIGTAVCIALTGTLYKYIRFV
ncbi:MAG: HAD-IC family P-type ATPase [Bacillota bacterium]|nr:HAD-IC family P-type ATPase [Bacillota bacterium]